MRTTTTTTRTRTLALAPIAALLVAVSLSTAAPAGASLPPAETRGQIYCSPSQASAHPAAEVNKGGAPGWVWSIFYVHDSRTGRWTSSDWVISYGGYGRQPSYYWTGAQWAPIGHGGVTFPAATGSVQALYELRCTQNQVMGHGNPTWSTEWVYGGQCSTSVQRPW